MKCRHCGKPGRTVLCIVEPLIECVQILCEDCDCKEHGRKARYVSTPKPKLETETVAS